MKKLFSLLLSVMMILTAVFCPATGIIASADDAVADTYTEWSITNNYDDEGVYYLSSPNDSLNWRRKANSTDTFYSGISIESDRIKDAVFARGTMATDETQGRYYTFSKAYVADYTSTPNYIAVYDSNAEDKSMYTPQNGTTYAISFKYKSTVAKSASSLLLNIYGLTSTTETVGTAKEMLNTVLTVPKTVTVTEWAEAVGYFKVEKDYEGLILSLVSTATDETTVASGTSATVTIDDVVLTKIENDAFINTYDDANISYFKSDYTSNWRRRISSTTASFGSGTSPDSGKIKDAAFANGTFTEDATQGRYFTFSRAFVDSYTSTPNYVALYDSFASDRTMMTPDKNATYKISFKYKSTVVKNASALKLNVYGLTSTTGEVGTSKENLATVITIPKKTTVTEWTNAEAYFTVGNTDYKGLLLSLVSTATDDTTVKSGTTAGFSIDDIVVTRVEYGAVINNYDDLGVYYTTSSEAEDSYGNWRRKDSADATFYTTSIDGTTIKDGVFARGIFSDTATAQKRSYSFKKAFVADYTGTPDYVAIYDSFAEDRGMYVPESNTTYKISFKFKSETVKYASALHLNMYGLTSATESVGTSRELLNNLLIIPKNTTVTEWTEAVGYFTVDSDYAGLILSLVSTATDETTVASGTTAKFSIDDIVITKVGSFAVDSIAPVGEQTDGFAVLNAAETALYPVTAGENIKITYQMSNLSSADFKVAVQFFAEEQTIADYGIGGETVDLFNITATNETAVSYETTVKAPISGNAVIILYSNGEAITDADVLIENFKFEGYTPSIAKGDTNLDGDIDVRDLVSLKKKTTLKYAVSGDFLINADIDKSGELEAADMVILRKLLLGAYENDDSLTITANYSFANETAGSAEGVITLTSAETVNNYVELYWGNENQPIADFYYIGATHISGGTTAEIAMDARLAIPDGATQIIVYDGIGESVLDIPASKLYDGSFAPATIAFLKDYTVDNNIANVKVVYPADSSDDTYNIACEFRNGLSAVLGAEIELISDSAALDSSAYYILLGKTSLSESTAAVNEIVTGRENYSGDFIIREANRKIVIAADSDYALQFAINYFFSNYCTDETSTVEAGFNYASSEENALGTITLAGTDIAEYTVVYPETASILEVDAAEYLVSNVLKKTGEILTVADDSAAVSDYEILIGNTNRTNAEYATTAAGNVENSYSISVGTNNTAIVSTNVSAINAGVIDFTTRILRGILNEGTYTGSYDGTYSLTNGYKLTWSDEFDGTALSDTWTFCDTDGYDTVTGGKTEFLMENATVSGGTLKATSYMDGADSKGLGIYTRGTDSKYFKYGYFEARIKLSDIEGFTTAMWMTTIGKEIDGLTCYGEFDILEMYSANNEIYPNLHNHSTAENHKNYLQGDNAPKPTVSTDGALGEKFHNFGMEWTDNAIHFYLDGRRYYSFDCTGLPEYDVFDQFASISLTINAGLYAEPEVQSSVAYVDWVRVWQKDEAGYGIR